MADIVHEAQDTHLCALFIGAHGDTGDYEYALDAANSAARHLQAILAELADTSPLARDAGILAKSVRAAQRNLSQHRPPQTQADSLRLGKWWNYARRNFRMWQTTWKNIVMMCWR